MNWLALGFFGCALGVAAGAFGAHGLRDRLDVVAMEQWLTAVRYWMIASFAVAILGLANQRGVVTGASAGWVACGGLIFAAAVGGLALGGPRWLGAIAPIGGASMIVGLGLAAWKIWRGAA